MVSMNTQNTNKILVSPKSSTGAIKKLSPTIKPSASRIMTSTAKKLVNSSKSTSNPSSTPVKISPKSSTVKPSLKSEKVTETSFKTSTTPIKPSLKPEKATETGFKTPTTPVRTIARPNSKVSPSTPTKKPTILLSPSSKLIVKKLTKPLIKPVIKNLKTQSSPDVTSTQVPLKPKTKVESPKSNVIGKTSSPLKSQVKLSPSPSRILSKTSPISNFKNSTPKLPLLSSPKSSKILSQEIKPTALKTKEKLSPLIKKIQSSPVSLRSSSRQTIISPTKISTSKLSTPPKTTVSKGPKNGIKLKLNISKAQKYQSKNLQDSKDEEALDSCPYIKPLCSDESFDACKIENPNFDVIQAYKLAEQLIRIQEDENLTKDWCLKDSILNTPSFTEDDNSPSWNSNETFPDDYSKQENSEDNISEIIEPLDNSIDEENSKTESASSEVGSEFSNSTESETIVNSIINKTEELPQKLDTLITSTNDEKESKNYEGVKQNELSLTLAMNKENEDSSLQITPIKCEPVLLSYAEVLKKVPKILVNTTNLRCIEPPSPVYNVQKEYQIMKKVENLQTKNMFLPKIDDQLNDLIYDSDFDDIEYVPIRKKNHKKMKQLSKRYFKNVRKDFETIESFDVYITPVWKNIY